MIELNEKRIPIITQLNINDTQCSLQEKILHEISKLRSDKFMAENHCKNLNLVMGETRQNLVETDRERPKNRSRLLILFISLNYILIYGLVWIGLTQLYTGCN